MQSVFLILGIDPIKELKIMRHLTKNILGFSMVQVIIAAGLLSGLSLVMMNMQDTSNRSMKTLEARSEIMNFHSRLNAYLGDKETCETNFKNTLATTAGSAPAILVLVDSQGNELAKDGEFYGNRAFQIENMKTEWKDSTHVNLVMVYKKGSGNSKIYGGKTTIKKISLAVTLDGAGSASDNILTCWVEFDTMINQAVTQSCQGDAASLDSSGALYVCNHNITPQDCPSGQLIKQTITAAGKIEYICANVIKTPQNCGTNMYVKSVSATGDVTCALLPDSACPANQYAHQLDDGTVTCRAISTCAGVLKGAADGSFSCISNFCTATANQYVAGFTSAGEPICNVMPSSSCGANEFIKTVNADGTIECAVLPPTLLNPQVSYSFIDGFLSTGQATRKTIEQTSQKVCAYMKGFTWSAGKCIPPAIATPNMPKLLGTYSVDKSTTNRKMTVSSSSICSLMRVASNDEFKESSYFNCEIYASSGYWYLKSSWEDTNSLYCNAVCYGTNCTPAVSCTTLRSNTCTCYSVTNSCGVSCGSGTKSCPIACATPTPSGCLVPGTLISMASGEKVPIENVKIGQKLLNYKHEASQIVKRLEIFYDGQIYAINSGPYFFSNVHPLLTTDGWKSINPSLSIKSRPGLKITKLSVGDKLISAKGIIEIKELRSRHYKGIVYDFTLKDDPEFFANDIVVHNITSTGAKSI